MKTLALPDLGEGLHEAEIVAWHVSIGDHVVADQPLVSVETEKAVVEIPAPWSGRIARLHGQPGDRVTTGSALVEYEETAASDTGTVVGALPKSEAGPSAPRPGSAGEPAPSGVKATPAVRALARKLGVELGAVAPSGPDGLVTRSDIERAARSLSEAGPPEPLRGVRRAMAGSMTRSHAEVVPATLTDEADVDVWPAGTDVTVRLVRAIVAACRAEPALNAWYDGKAVARRLHRKVDLAVAMDTGDGLFAPVLRHVEARDPADIRRGLEAMKRDVLARTVPLEELRGATITISNFGMLGGRHAALVVVPPQVAIIGAGRIAPRVTAIDGQPAVRRLLPLSLTFDHRAVTGGEAARFLAALVADLQQRE
ncbi:MAG TPA: dihydrolipoamide acetyltransferase family protein [Dongiaceae bacterium]|nr:dihydrolipoamide acetyltransferase family protein [Dongiaceae bacterium]